MFDESVKFKYSWRDYQQHVLDKAQQFVNDGHIHVVAAPGSGKTVLGLELMRRINLPTLILAPTIAIRNQWAERFTSLFMDSNDSETLPTWLSLDAKKPAQLTIITYQGLYSVLAGSDNEPKPEEATTDTYLEAPEEVEEPVSDEIVIPTGELITQTTSRPEINAPENANPKAAAFIKQLNELGIRTVIVDEAHHLRNEWWRSLSELKTGLQDPVVIALTATPPYDAEAAEWRKYQSFCGPIDIEVSVPELVARGDLCPHQDYVYLSMLNDAETESAQAVKTRIKNYIEKLGADKEFISALLQHPVFTQPQSRESLVFNNPEYFTAVGAFLLATGHKKDAKPLLKMISGRNYGRMPAFNEQQAEVLLTNSLYRDVYFTIEANEALVKCLRDAGSRAGAIEAGQVCLTNNKAFSTILKNSVSKLESVRSIVTFEQATFGSNLRCVILTDYIRQEYIPPTTNSLTKLGVVPIFETIRSSVGKTKTNKIGVLSGVIVVIPTATKDKFSEYLQAVAVELDAAAPKVAFKAYPTDEQYVICNVNDQTRQFVVRAVTQLFEEGHIEILVGTKSLLGEGWDAPAINSLVLASVVGTFMLSNQMRGRAIRTDRSQPDKVANIWHIATILPGAREIISPFSRVTRDLGPEYDLLTRRFETFVGINAHRNSIESGLNRALYLEAGPYKVALLASTIEQANNLTFAAARDKPAVTERWQQALAGNNVGQLVHTTEMRQPKLPRKYVYTQTLQAALVALVANWLSWVQAAPSIISHTHATDPKVPIIMAFIIIVGTSLYTLIKFLGYAILAIRHFSPEGSMQQVGEALLHTLVVGGFVKTPETHLQVIATKASDGTISCGLKGSATYENDLFLDCLEELLSPIANPRYLLQSGGKYRFIRAGYNNYSVPTLLGQHKKTVLTFLSAWRKQVGPCRGVYTRTLQGRRVLLKARRESLSGHLDERSARHSIWT